MNRDLLLFYLEKAIAYQNPDQQQTDLEKAKLYLDNYLIDFKIPIEIEIERKRIDKFLMENSRKDLSESEIQEFLKSFLKDTNRNFFISSEEVLFKKSIYHNFTKWLIENNEDFFMMMCDSDINFLLKYNSSTTWQELIDGGSFTRELFRPVRNFLVFTKKLRWSLHIYNDLPLPINIWIFDKDFEKEIFSIAKN